MTKKLYVALLEELDRGAELAQCAHAVTEMHARHPAACEAWRTGGNTVAVVSLDAEGLGRLAACPATAPFFEPDRDMEMTAVAAFESELSRPILRRAKLAG